MTLENPAAPQDPMRRPLRSRGTAWAIYLAKRLCAIGATPNQISILSIIFALFASVSLSGFGMVTAPPAKIFLLIAALIGIQGRLLCNLLDGMLAIECGLKSKSGEVFNELPDRVSDVLILFGAGLALGAEQIVGISGAMIGLLSGLGAVITAYVRLLGVSCGTPHYFVGPMAKQHRMAFISAVSLIQIVILWKEGNYNLFGPALLILILGIIWTTVRRVKLIVSSLEGRVY